VTTSLSVALREATDAEHKRAESSEFITGLLRGASCFSAFTALAVQQYIIYQALEDVLHEHYLDHRLLAAVDDRRLDRTPSIQRDLTTLIGTDFEVRLADGTIPICAATAAYARVLREEHSPEMILAHHYVRYLGDLSGGQVISRLVQRHYDVPRQALHFYRFDGIEKLKVYKDNYRAALDRIALDHGQKHRILGHAARAFDFSAAVFADLTSAKSPLHRAAGLAG